VKYRHDPPKQWFKCDACDRQFRFHSDLKRHSLVHGSVCKVCGRGFPGCLGLIDHMRSHDQKCTCSICHKGFQNERLLQSHVKYGHDPPKQWFQCEACDRQFRFASQLKKHSLVHGSVEDRSYVCKVCGSKFPERLELIDHMHYHDQKCMCSICHKGFENEWLLQRHVKYRHDPPKQWFKCDACDRQFRFQSELKRHSVVHGSVEDSKDTSYVCEVCGRGFPERLRLIGHMHTHDQKCTFECRYCRKMFGSTEARADHEKVHVDAGEEMLNPDPSTGSANDSFVCFVCGKVFTTFRSLKRHVRYTHDPPKQWYKCDRCDKQYRFPSYLKAHSLVHASRDARPHVCSVCSQGFVHRYSLLEHMRCHTGERPYACRVCEKTFAQIGTRNTHEMVHNSVFPHICSECGLRFKLRGHLTIHTIRKHQDSRPHACLTCGKRFKMAFSLKLHHRRAHSTECPYVCEECPSQFKDMHGLKRHINAVHLGLKPWHCKVCSKAFTVPENLRTHMRVHTGERPYVCDVCGMRFAHSGTHKSHLRTHSNAQMVSGQSVQLLPVT